jgi:hypothetical protein
MNIPAISGIAAAQCQARQKDLFRILKIRYKYNDENDNIVGFLVLQILHLVQFPL